MRTNEEALDLLADLLEPFSELLSDKDFVSAFQKRGNKIPAIQLAIKNHKGAVIQILATLEGVPVEEYTINFWLLPKKILNYIQKPDVKEGLNDLFTLGSLEIVSASSGSATENIKDGATK